MNDRLLLDTCAIIWLGNGDRLSEESIDALKRVRKVVVSPISAWELGLVSRLRASRPASPAFVPDVRTWFARFMARPSVEPAPFSMEMALDAANLPGAFHNDPADRLLVATARHMSIAIVTRDRKILDYAQAGFVDAVAC